MNAKPSGPKGASGLSRRGNASGRRSKANNGGGGGPVHSDGMLRFYTEDAPGLRIGPTTVLVLSLLFIAFVVLLHIWGKFQSA